MFESKSTSEVQGITQQLLWIMQEVLRKQDG